MKNITIFILLIIVTSCTSTLYRTEKISPIDNQLEDKIEIIFERSELINKLDYNIFRMAMVGLNHLDIPKKDVISIIDYSMPSIEKRYFLIDLNTPKILYNTLIAHGKNSGENMATVFSNVRDSKISSLGFFVTAETYIGDNGYSLRLDGIEKGINHNARKRLIVIHMANYVSEEFIEQEGRLGRSWGCPALPNEVSNNIIDVIKEGSCVFVYGKDESYIINSNFVE